MQIYYFTSAQHAINNLALRRLKVARYRDLNDPFELQAFRPSLDGPTSSLSSAINELEDREGLLCFTTNWKSPLMWSHYADKHQGICLGFDVPDGDLVKVEYQKTLEAFKGDAAADVGAFLRKLKRTKFVDWEYEKEWRKFVPLSECTTEGGHKFIGFDEGGLQLNEIVLGPRCVMETVSLERLLDDMNVQVRLQSSRTGSDGFEIVRHRMNLGAAIKTKLAGFKASPAN